MSNANEDLFKVLEVSPDATDEEIKKSFRRLAKKFHPDKNRNDPKIGERFKAINKAYAILSDKRKRADYESKQRLDRMSMNMSDMSNFMDPFEMLFSSFGEHPFTSFFIPGFATSHTFSSPSVNAAHPQRRRAENDDIADGRRRRLNRNSGPDMDDFFANPFARLFRGLESMQAGAPGDSSCAFKSMSRTYRDDAGHMVTEKREERLQGGKRSSLTRLTKKVNGKIHETVKEINDAGVETVTVLEDGVVKRTSGGQQAQIAMEKPKCKTTVKK